MFPKGFPNIPKQIPKMFAKGFPKSLQMFPKCFPTIPQRFPKDSPNLSHRVHRDSKKSSQRFPKGSRMFQKFPLGLIFGNALVEIYLCHYLKSPTVLGNHKLISTMFTRIATITLTTTFTMTIEDGTRIAERVVWEIEFVGRGHATRRTVMASTKKPWRLDHTLRCFEMELRTCN